MATSPARAALDRFHGVDVARAIAIVFMFGSHIGDHGPVDGDPEGWAWLYFADGMAAPLFTLLVGVSISLMLTRRWDGSGRPPADQARYVAARLLARGAILVVLGYMLSALGTPIIVILANLGLMSVLAIPALRLRSVELLVLAVPFLGLGFWVTAWAEEAAARTGLAILPGLDLLWSDVYPVISWMGLIFVGMALGRLRPTAPVAGAVGAAAFAAGLGVQWWGATATGTDLFTAKVWGPTPWTAVSALANTPVSMAAALLMAIGIVGACIAVTRWTWPVPWPIAKAGEMSLTLYVIQVIVVSWAGRDIVYAADNRWFILLTVSCVAFASLWAVFFRRGPLEMGLHSVSESMATSLPGVEKAIESQRS